VKPFAFDKDAAVAAVLYIASRAQDPTFHRIFKLMYFADKAHLERYGRFICGDSYVAMKHGPVPTAVYDILKAVRGGNSSFISEDVMAAFKGALSVVDYTVVPLKEPDLDALSDSDIECLEEAVKRYGDKAFKDLENASHDFAWENVDENDFMRIEDNAATFQDNDELLKYLRDPFPG
jgi:uncharacterized phage-associated protein